MLGVVSRRRNWYYLGAFQDSHGEYPGIVRAVAAENKVPLIDMHRKSERVIKQYGVEESKRLFLQLRPNENPNYPNGIEHNTHFSPLGARIMAGLVVEGIRELKLGLAKYLKKQSAAESKLENRKEYLGERGSSAFSYSTQARRLSTWLEEELNKSERRFASVSTI